MEKHEKTIDSSRKTWKNNYEIQNIPHKMFYGKSEIEGKQKDRNTGCLTCPHPSSEKMQAEPMRAIYFFNNDMF